jgi:hypothetical protein
VPDFGPYIETGGKESSQMRVHQNQVNPYAQLDAMHAAQKAAAKRQAERTRKKLFELASESSSEADAEACIVQLEPHEGQDVPEQTNQNQSPNAKQYRTESDSTEEPKPISDWI